MKTTTNFIISLLATSLLLSEASTESTCSPSSEIYTFKFGDWNATIINDGPMEGLKDFYTVPSFAVVRAFRYYYPSAPLLGAQNVLLLQNQNDMVLFDAGFGDYLIPGLRSVGVRPEDITAIFATHLHIDHIRGVLDKSGNASFPNARIFTHRADHAFWRQNAAQVMKQAPHLPLDIVVRSATSTYHKVMKAYAGKIRLLNDGEEAIGGITAMLTPGHTPGHVAYLLRSGRKRLAVVGDTLGGRTTSVQHPEWNVLSDTNRTEVIMTRYKLMDKLADDKTLTLLYHDVFPGLGHIVRNGPGFDLSFVARLG